jgi:hypothetical protein
MQTKEQMQNRTNLPKKGYNTFHHGPVWETIDWSKTNREISQEYGLKQLDVCNYRIVKRKPRPAAK